MPDPVPPAFLAAEAQSGTVPHALHLQPMGSFDWKGSGALAPKVQSSAAPAPVPPVPLPLPSFTERQESRVLSADMLELVLQESARVAPPRAALASSSVSHTPAAPLPQPGGYELPYAEEFEDTPLPPEVPELESGLELAAVQTREAAGADPAASSEPEPADLAVDRGVEGMAADGLDVLASLPAIPPDEAPSPQADAMSAADTAAAAKPSLPSVEFPSMDSDWQDEDAVTEHRQGSETSAPAETLSGMTAADDVSFVKAARRRAFWRRPLVRAALVLGGLGLVTALAAQVAVHERNRLAAMEPRLRPVLSALCQPLGCELAPQRQISDVVIDSSSFNKARGDSYVLAVTMKSRATIPLEMPAVELTLTDAQDQPVLRRVLLPAEMSAPHELPAGGEWSASVSVLVTTGGSRVAGYRLLAFYP